jgi:hypothetical protein
LRNGLAASAGVVGQHLLLAKASPQVGGDRLFICLKKQLEEVGSQRWWCRAAIDAHNSNAGPQQLTAESQASSVVLCVLHESAAWFSRCLDERLLALCVQSWQCLQSS